MKVRKGFIIPVILGVMVSSCATTSPTSQNTTTLESDQKESSAQKTERDQLDSTIANKDIVIEMLEQQLLENQIQIDLLIQDSTDKDNLIAALQLDNNLLSLRIEQLEKEKLELETMASLAVESDSVLSDKKEPEVFVDSQTDKEILTALKKENQELADTLSNAIAQISEHRKSSQTYKANWDELKNKLALVQEQNDNLRDQLNGVQVNLLSTQDKLSDTQSELSDTQYQLSETQSKHSETQNELSINKTNLSAANIKLKALTLEFNEVQQLLKLTENEGVSIAEAMEALQSQVTARLLNVQWRLPNEASLGESFDVVISANVNSSLTGQVYRAELVSGSEIQIAGSGVSTATVQNGRVQWSWRVTGVTESPNAQMSLFVSQEIELQGQSFIRQVYRADDNVTLVNDNLLEKYGYWAGGIIISLIVGLFLGLLIGRAKKETTTSNS